MTEHDDIPSVDDAGLASAAPEESDATVQPAAAPGEAERGERIQQLIRQKQAADAVAARSSAEAAALRNGIQAPGRPQDYNAPEDYNRAIAEQAVRQVGADMFARQAAQAQEASIRAAQEAWSAATAEFRQKVPDFDAVVNNPNLAVTPMMASAIQESSRAAEIAYYLGKNLNEAAQIASLPPLSQATAVARLEGRLGSTAASVSRAPQPVGTLAGRGGAGGKALEDMDFEEYRRARGF
jgi:hypothetical protein